MLFSVGDGATLLGAVLDGVSSWSWSWSCSTGFRRRRHRTLR